MKNDLSAEDYIALESFIEDFVDPAAIRAMFLNTFPKEKVEIKASMSLSTAATKYDAETKTHHVYIGADHKDINGLESDISVKKYALSLLIHEFGHSLYTELDMKKILSKCKDVGIPFSLFNLAEDARIEIKMKKLIFDSVKLKYMYGWEEWLSTPEENSNMSAESILFSMINTENSKAFTLSPKASLVGRFYDRFIKAKDSIEVIDILKEWKDIFHPEQDQKNQQCNQQGKGKPSAGKGGSATGDGQKGDKQMEQLENAIAGLMQQIAEDNPPKSEADGGGAKEEGKKNEEKGRDKAGAGENETDDASDDKAIRELGATSNTRNFNDIAISAMLRESQALASALDRRSLGVKEVSEYKPEEGRREFNTNARFGDTTIVEASNTEAIFQLKNGDGPYFKEEYSKIVSLLKKMKETKNKTLSTRAPSRKMNIKSMAHIRSSPNTTKLYKEERKIDKRSGKKILFILDLSGSMGGKPVDSQRTIMLAMNELAAKKEFEIEIIASKVAGSKSLYQTLRLPCDPSLLLSMRADGDAEGIRYAVDKNKKMFEGKDAVVFITDGRIHDKEISKAHLSDVIKNGIVSVGMYVGREGIYNKKMADWFDVLVTNNDLVSAVENLVDVLKNPIKSIPLKKKNVDSTIESRIGNKM
jgi:hypothetical protein